MNLTPDQNVFLEYGFIKINATLVFSWAVMAILLIVSILVTRKLSTGPKVSRWQILLETIVGAIRKQIKDIIGEKPGIIFPFVATLFLFVGVSNLLTVVPYYEPPTSSFSVAAALAVTVFLSTPVFGIIKAGVGPFFKHYIEPSPVMLPFNIISEVSRTLALAVRLFGNMLSGTMIAGVLLSIAPLFFPLIMQALGLIIGMIQAYIFAALSAVYIGSATVSQEKTADKNKELKQRWKKKKSKE
jgi:F-type H+-transporting ATPase subunit a